MEEPFEQNSQECTNPGAGGGHCLSGAQGQECDLT